MRTSPIPLATIATSGFKFSNKESYLVLFIKKTDFEGEKDVTGLPDSLWEVLHSSVSLSPRGLKTAFADNADSDAGSGLFSARPTQKQDQFCFSIHVWNGREANSVVKASAIAKAGELNALATEGKDFVLKVLFSGGVIRDKKLQRGSVYMFSEVLQTKETSSPEQMRHLFD